MKKVIISGAPASGKGTQCEKIVEQYGVAHISTGDLLRAEVKAGTPAGLQAKSYMESGGLVPDEVVITMVKNRLAEEDARTKGWLLDGFPRTAAQAQALKEAGIVPDCFILLEVPDEILIERVVGRRMDPETGKIYHLKFSPPPAEIAGRLTQRSDDNEEAARKRLATYAKNVAAVVGSYKDTKVAIDGNRAKSAVYTDIQTALMQAEQAQTKAHGKKQEGVFAKRILACTIGLAIGFVVGSIIPAKSKASKSEAKPSTPPKPQGKKFDWRIW